MPQLDSGIVFQTSHLFILFFIAHYLIFRIYFVEKALVVLKGRIRLLQEVFA
jgi:hypothetical protein